MNAGRQSKMHSIHDLNLEADFKWDIHLVGYYFIRKWTIFVYNVIFCKSEQYAFKIDYFVIDWSLFVYIFTIAHKCRYKIMDQHTCNAAENYMDTKLHKTTQNYMDTLFNNTSY